MTPSPPLPLTVITFNIPLSPRVIHVFAVQYHGIDFAREAIICSKE